MAANSTKPGDIMNITVKIQDVLFGGAAVKVSTPTGETFIINRKAGKKVNRYTYSETFGRLPNH